MYTSILADSLSPNKPIFISKRFIRMYTKKHTIKECKSILRSCISMLDALYGFVPSSNFVAWRNGCYNRIAHISTITPESQLSEPWLFDRIISLYNEINNEYLKL